MISGFIRRVCSGAALGGAALLLPGCATPAPALRAPELSAEESPRALVVPLREAWKRAEAYAAAHPGTEVFIGRGPSMLPLYPDRTVLVVRAMPLADLRRGMTVVFVGERGQAVAHVLREKTSAGWTAQGLNNAAPDPMPVRLRNYIGAVVQAYTPEASAAAGERLPVPAPKHLVADNSAVAAKSAVVFRSDRPQDSRDQ